MRRGGVPWVVLSFGCALACGGRYQEDAPAPDALGFAGGPASSSGGASDSGSTSIAGSSAVTGGNGAVVGSAGAMTGGCADQFTAYSEYRSQVMAQFASFGCTANSDCISQYYQSACDPSCVLVTSAASRGVIDRLNIFESHNCSSDCAPQPWVTCPTAEPAYCVAGRCQ